MATKAEEARLIRPNIETANHPEWTADHQTMDVQPTQTINITRSRKRDLDTIATIDLDQRHRDHRQNLEVKGKAVIVEEVVGIQIAHLHATIEEEMVAPSFLAAHHTMMMTTKRRPLVAVVDLSVINTNETIVVPTREISIEIVTILDGMIVEKMVLLTETDDMVTMMGEETNEATTEVHDLRTLIIESLHFNWTISSTFFTISPMTRPA